MALMAFSNPFSKQMQVFGQELQALTPQQIRTISQTTNFFPNPGRENLLSERALGAARPPLGSMSVGFLSGLGKIFGGIGTAVHDISGIATSIGAAIHPAATAAGKAATVAIDTAKAGGKAVAAHPVLAASAAAAGMAAGAGGMAAMGGTGAAKAHLTRVKKALGLHHRRMHVTNTRALHRALRRVKGFERVAKRVLSITHHRPTKVHFKFRKRRAA